MTLLKFMMQQEADTASLRHTPTEWSSLVSHDGECHWGLDQNLVGLEEDKTLQGPS